MDIFKVFSDEQLTERLFRVAADEIKHQDYQRTLDVAKWCKQVNTGDDQKEILIKYRVNESEKQKEQRYRVYNSRTPQVCNKVKALYNEVHRSDDVIDNIKYDGDGDESKAKVESLETYCEKFDGLKSARSYLTRRNKYYNFFDPNAWVVVEFEGDGKDRMIYPFEVSSKQAYDFHVERGVLQYLTGCIERVYKDQHNNAVVNRKYTLYASKINIDIIEVPENRTKLKDWVEPEGYQIIKRTNTAQVVKEFFFKIYRTENKYCPASRFGFMEDVETDCRTCISPLHLSEKSIQRLIWRTSTLDISHACHGFYKMMMYTERCNHREVIEGNQYHCDNGYIGSNPCKSCKGTGKRMHVSDQDVVMYLIDQSNNTGQLTPLSSLIHYATISTDLIKEQKQEVEDAISDSLSTIFNENIFDKSILANTATGIHYNWRSVNNRLMDYADHDAELYTFIVRTIAMIQNIDQGLEVEYGYASDFKLESIQELLTERKTAVDSSTPAEVIKSLDLKILSKQHRDNPDYVARFKVKDQFKPLRTKKMEERIMILESLPEFHPMKILNQYHDEIFDTIFALRPNFVEIPYLKQKQLVEEEVQKVIEIEKTLREANTLNFNVTPEPDNPDEPIDDDEPENQAAQ